MTGHLEKASRSFVAPRPFEDKLYDPGSSAIRFLIEKTELIKLKKKVAHSSSPKEANLDHSTVARSFIEGGYNTKFSSSYGGLDESSEFTVSNKRHSLSGLLRAGADQAQPVGRRLSVLPAHALQHCGKPPQ